MDLPEKEFDSQVSNSVEKPPDESERIQCTGQEAGYIEEILGLWDVKYPGSDEMIREDYVEKLELKRDGTYSWNAPPPWAPSSGEGEWGVIKTRDGLKLCFEDTHGRWRGGYLVLMRIREDGRTFMNWTRNRGDAVFFADRIWRADRPKRH